MQNEQINATFYNIASQLQEQMQPLLYETDNDNFFGVPDVLTEEPDEALSLRDIEDEQRALNESI